MIYKAHKQSGIASVALAVLLFAVSGLYWSRTWLEKHPIPEPPASQTPLYLPNIKYVRSATLGFDTLASKILWFNTVNYFGKQLTRTHDYRWLGHMCDLVTYLDPRGRHVFEFCATLLSWVAKDWDKSIEILNRAVDEEPHYWRYRYLRAFNYWYFKSDTERAKDDMLLASASNEAPAFVKTLSSRMLAADEGPVIARQFLEDALRNTSDPAVKKLFKRKWRKARLAELRQMLEGKIADFEVAMGRKPSRIEELVDRGLLSEIPKDPWKGTFYLDDHGALQTTSGVKGLHFAGRTATTGLAKHEFLGDER